MVNLPRTNRSRCALLRAFKDYIDTLKRPKRALIVDVPIVMDDGTIQHFEGYRVQHNLSRGRVKVVFVFIRC